MDTQPRPAIRALAWDELEPAREIERAAGGLFAVIGMPEIAADEPLSVDELDRFRRAGLAWTAIDPDDRPMAYLIAGRLGNGLHLEQLSVHPRAARRQVGRGLIEHAAAYAAASGLACLTLTTFAEVPWNAPYYRRCGFRVLEEDEWGPGLRAIREEEAARGLDRWPRVCMRRDLTE